MPRMKVDISDRDLQELEEAEYEEGQYESYDGEQPPVGTELSGFIKKMWWTYSQNDDDMLKILFVADGNDGEESEFEGCPIWENYALISTMKFKWAPFLDAIGLSIRDVIKKTHVEEEEDGNNGQPILKIGTWQPGSDASYCRVVTARHKYDGDWQTDVGTWLPYEDEEDETEPEEEPARPTRKSPRSKSSADGAATSSRSGRRTPRRGREADEVDEADAGDDEGDDVEGDEEAEKPATRAGTRRTAGRASRAPGGTRGAKPATGRRGGRKSSGGDDDEEVPF